TRGRAEDRCGRGPARQHRPVGAPAPTRTVRRFHRPGPFSAYPPPSLQAVDQLGLWNVVILSPSAAHQLPSDQPTSCASLLVHVCADTCPAQFCSPAPTLPLLL